MGGWTNWIEHPTWTLEAWRADVAADETRLGYGDWVEHMDATDPVKAEDLEDLDQL
ncbi:hypothetical protein SEA_ANON_37 [Gordonia phage Anon]|nr:hypothetical protein SEA_ANON_37 [Gordonia phage Anon]